MKTISWKNLTWIDIYKPSDSDIESLKKDYQIHPVVLKELRQETLRPHADNYGDYLYLVLHFPMFNEQERRSYPKEIDFIIKENLVITTHFDKFETIAALAEKLEKDESAKEKYFSRDAGYLLYSIISGFLDFSLREFDHIKLNIDRAQDQVFRGKEKEMVKEISFIRHDILNFRRTILPQRPILESLGREVLSFFSPSIRYYFDELIGKFSLIWNHLENQKEAIEALQETNDSLLSTRTNEVIKTLTVVTSIVFTLSLISDIYTIYLSSLGVGMLAAFPAISTIMLAIALAMLGIFRWKKWF